MRKQAISAAVLLTTLVAISCAVASPAQAAGTQAMYRLYNPWSGEHLFTADAGEYDSLGAIGWIQEGEAWESPSEGPAVYRLYNQWSGDHLYTGDAEEYARLASVGWTQEGVSFHTAGKVGDEDAGDPIYRLYNPYVSVGTHLYTSDESEYYILVGQGWSGEAVAFTAQSVPKPSADQLRRERRMRLACDFVTDYLGNTVDDGEGPVVRVLGQDEWLERVWAYVDPSSRWVISEASYTSEPQRVWNVRIAWIDGDTYAVSYDYIDDEEGLMSAQLWPAFNESDLITAWS